MDLTQAVKQLREIKDRKDLLEAELKEVNGEIRRLSEQVIPEMMDDQDIEKLTVEGVGTCYLSTKIYANVKAENKEQFYSWLTENGHGDLIREHVFPASLNAFAKEQLQEGKALPDFLEARLYPTATIRRK